MNTMTNAIQSPPQRRLFQGVMQIVRFNWPMYVTAFALAFAAMLAAALLPVPTWARLAIVLCTAGGLFWTVASLVVSYWVYDCSPLCQWRWVAELFAMPPAVWLNVHCGFDESTLALRSLFPGTLGRPLDIFNAPEMTEPSILRARRLPTGQPTPEPADYRCLPADDASVDAVFAMLSAHELRRPAARATLFREFARVLKNDGQIVVAEHLRDAANFVAFGPGFVHFHSRAEWPATFRDAGLRVEREFRITPFVAVFVLRKAES